MLTPRQKQILDFINHAINKRSVAPTHWEIARHFRLSSPATVNEHLQALHKKGYIEKHPRRARALKPKKQSRFSTRILLTGTVSAGGPIEAIRNPEPIEVPRSMLSRSGNHYALRISGTSMIEEGISDGDVVIVREQPTIENGETAVAYLPDKNEVTLKRIYREKSRIRLQPANKKMKPFYERSIEIQGKVIGVLRKIK